MGSINASDSSSISSHGHANNDNDFVMMARSTSSDLWLIAATHNSNHNNNNNNSNNSNNNSNSNTTYSTTSTTSATKTPKVALASSITKRNEIISNRDFENGYTVRKISNLEELRDGLISLLPPPLPSSSSSSPPVPSLPSLPSLPVQSSSSQRQRKIQIPNQFQVQKVRVRSPSTRLDEDNNDDHYDNDNDYNNDYNYNNNNNDQENQQINQNQKQRSTEIQGLDEIKRFELFRSVIQHEDDLLNQRVSWIILAQSFLMAAYITSSGPDSLRFVTASVGLATVIVTMPAIVAAGQNIEIQQEIYFKSLPSEKRSRELHGHGRDVTVKEDSEAITRLRYGHLLPTMAFRGKRSVRILRTVIILAMVQFIGWVFLLLALLLNVGM
jgi:hypothetical protein